MARKPAERAVGATPSPTVAVPASLHASLMARLDRLGPAKEVAQIGAVIGREFSHPPTRIVGARGSFIPIPASSDARGVSPAPLL